MNTGILASTLVKKNSIKYLIKSSWSRNNTSAPDSIEEELTHVKAIPEDPSIAITLISLALLALESDAQVLTRLESTQLSPPT